MELVNSTKSLKKQHEKAGDLKISGGLFQCVETVYNGRFFLGRVLPELLPVLIPV